MDSQPHKDSKNNQRRSHNKIKPVHVAFISLKLKKEFSELQKGKFEDKKLYKSIDSALTTLKENPTSGTKIKKKLWPKKYIQEHKITNLWKFNLPEGWRIIYTIETNEVMVLNIILDWFDHKEYENKFKY